MHKKYDAQTFSIAPYDIAIIQLQEDSMKQPCQLGIAGSGKVTAIGWGRSHRGRRAEVLQEVGLQVYDLHQCRSTPNFPPLIDSQLCAKEEGRDACAGQILAEDHEHTHICGPVLCTISSMQRRWHLALVSSSLIQGS